MYNRSTSHNGDGGIRNCRDQGVWSLGEEKKNEKGGQQYTYSIASSRQHRSPQQQALPSIPLFFILIFDFVNFILSGGGGTDDRGFLSRIW